jgi:hypothetical protein
MNKPAEFLDNQLVERLFIKHGGPVPNEGWCLNRSGLYDFLHEFVAAHPDHSGDGGEKHACMCSGLGPCEGRTDGSCRRAALVPQDGDEQARFEAAWHRARNVWMQSSRHSTQEYADEAAIDALQAALASNKAAAVAVGEPIPEGCTPAYAKMLREANHQLAAENDALRKRLFPFAQLVGTGELSWAMIEYCIKDDPEKQTFRAPQMQRAFNRAAKAWRDATPPAPIASADDAAPIPMLLFCPQCGTQHVDAPEAFTPTGRCECAGPDECEACEQNRAAYEETWQNPPHRSHKCHACGCIWRPADVATTGVETIATVGKKDNWDGPGAVAAHSAAAQPSRAEVLTDEEIDLIANDGMRNAAGGIYSTRVHEFARAVIEAVKGKP